MELQKYLRENGLEKLSNEYQIKVNRHQKYSNLVCLKYSQLNSPMNEIIVQQSRGIILDEAKNWQIISYSYDKFFNYGEPNAVNINWENATVYDKLDGSLMVLYYYNNNWQVQSSGTSDATGAVNGFPFTFADLFWRVWHELNYQLPNDKEYCFSFELLTPYNRIIVQQNNNDLILHGVRNLQTLQEENPKFWAEKYDFHLVKSFPLNNWQAILKVAENLDPMASEGYVICDANFNRVKVKAPQYVAIAHLRSGFSTGKMLQIILTNEGEEFLAYYPEWTQIYEQIKEKYDNLVKEIQETYEKYKNIPVQKDFALAIKHLPYSGILFALRGGKVTSIKEALINTYLPKVEELLGVENIYLGV